MCVLVCMHVHVGVAVYVHGWSVSYKVKFLARRVIGRQSSSACVRGHAPVDSAIHELKDVGICIIERWSCLSDVSTLIRNVCRQSQKQYLNKHRLHVIILPSGERCTQICVVVWSLNVIKTLLETTGKQAHQNKGNEKENVPNEGFQPVTLCLWSDCAKPCAMLLICYIIGANMWSW